MTVSEALSLPEEVERAFTERQRGFYMAIQGFAFVVVSMANSDAAPAETIDKLLIILKAMMDELQCNPEVIG